MSLYIPVNNAIYIHIPKTGGTSVRNYINALRPVSFDWIETGENSEGFLAHEVQEQVPYAVQGTHNELYTEDGVGEEQADLVGEPKYQQVDYGKLTPLLVKALQESNAKIEALETRIETLENA